MYRSPSFNVVQCRSASFSVVHVKGTAGHAASKAPLRATRRDTCIYTWQCLFCSVLKPTPRKALYGRVLYKKHVSRANSQASKLCDTADMPAV